MAILQSKVDYNEYKVLELENGIKVLLVRNNLFTKASCALSVKIGSYNEPEQFPGLAHFLEHMLFMGTEKYKGENMFMEFLNQHNGNTNAYTTNEHTTYYCDVDTAHLEEMADMFSQFFISPLFKSDTVDREISAVNSEYLNSLNSPGFRLMALCCDLMKKERIEGRFLCGNSETLRQENKLETVINFWKTKYSSDLMSLVICGSDEMDNLMQIANLFKGIKKRENCVENCNFSLDFFKPEFLSKIMHFKPLNDKKELIVITMLPPVRDSFKCNPLGYIDHFINMNGRNSLISILKDRQLAFEINMDSQYFNNYTEIIIKIGLTDKGIKEYETVLNLLSGFFSTLKADKNEYSRLGRIQEEEFNYLQTKTPIEIAETVCADMLFYPIEYVLKHDHTFENFDENLINNCIFNISNTDKWIVLLSNQNGTFEYKEKYYSVEYGIYSDKAIIGGFDIKNTVMSKDMHLDDIKIIKSENRYLKRQKYENGEINLVFDSQFNVPKAKVYIILSSDAINKNPLVYQLCFSILVDLFNEKHDGELTNAHVDLSTYVANNNIVLKFNGFSNHILSIAKLFLNTIYDSIEISEGRFEIMRQEIQSNFYGIITKSPYKRLGNVFYSKLSSSKSAEEYLEQLKGLNKEHMELVKNAYCSILAVGNIEFCGLESVLDCIKATSKKAVPFMDSNIKSIDFGTTDEFNNAIGIFYKINGQREEVDFKDHFEINDDIDINNHDISNDINNHDISNDINNNVLNDIINNNVLNDNINTSEYSYNTAVGRLILQIAQERFFNQLRTVEELGYIVYSTIGTFVSSEYLMFVVQSEKSVEFLEKRICDFVEDLKGVISGMDSEELEGYKESLVGFYEEPIVNLDDLAKEVMGQYANGEIDLNYNLKMIEQVKRLTKEDVLKSSIWSEYVKVSSFRKD